MRLRSSEGYEILPACAELGAESPVGRRTEFVILQEQRGRFAIALLTLPTGAGAVVRARSRPRDASQDGARDEFRIDAVSGRLVSSEIYADESAGEKTLARVLDIHHGSIFGWPGKLVFMQAAPLMPLFAKSPVSCSTFRDEGTGAHHHRRSGALFRANEPEAHHDLLNAYASCRRRNSVAKARNSSALICRHIEPGMRAASSGVCVTI
jgi:hypothetical protein